MYIRILHLDWVALQKIKVSSANKSARIHYLPLPIVAPISNLELATAWVRFD